MIPGANLLRMALRLIGPQTVVLYRFSARTLEPNGQWVSAFSSPLVVTEGSLQAVPVTRYAAMGLDYERTYVTWYTSALCQGAARDRAPDQFVWNGRLFDVHSVTPWMLQDGWNEVVGVDVGPASEVPVVTDWSDIENIPANVESLANLAATGAMGRRLNGDIRAYPGLVFVGSVADLPEAVNGAITLARDTTYFFTGTVDLAGSVLICSANTVIIGGSSENCRIRSTTLSSEVPMIYSAWSLPMRNITIEHGAALNLDASANPNQAIDWFGVNFTGCNVVGVIAGYNNVIFTDCALLDSANLTFDGSVGTIGFSQCLLSGIAGFPTIVVPGTADIGRRFRVIYSAFITPSGGTGISFSESAAVPVEGYILDTVNFSGAGAATSGVAYTDNKALFVNCKGVGNSAEIASYSMSANATVTDIVTQGIPVKVAGTTTASPLVQKFTLSNNRATYTGEISRSFAVSAVASITASAQNLQIGFYVAKNGAVIPSSEMYVTTNQASRAESVAIQSIVDLSNGDYVEVWVENDTNSTDVTVTFLNVQVQSVN